MDDFESAFQPGIIYMNKGSITAMLADRLCILADTSPAMSSTVTLHGAQVRSYGKEHTGWFLSLIGGALGHAPQNQSDMKKAFSKLLLM